MLPALRCSLGHSLTFTLARMQVPAADIVRLAAALERSSEHPLASAVLAFADTYLHQGPTEQQRQQQQQQQNPSTDSWQEREQQHDGELKVRGVEVVVGQGIRGWVHLPTDGRTGAQQMDMALFRALGSQCGSSSPCRSIWASTVPGSAHSRLAVTEECMVEARVTVGNRRLMADEGVNVPATVEDYCCEMEGRGCTCVMVAAGPALLGVLAVQDPIKPEARGVVSALHRRRLSCVLVTGDNWRTARAIAGQLGITRVAAEVLPAGKAAKVRELQSSTCGGSVAMVGDGINDSPALAVADVGIAVGSGTDIAIEAADFVLVRSDLVSPDVFWGHIFGAVAYAEGVNLHKSVLLQEDVLTAIDLSQTTFNRIRWNYFWALSYNCVMIPVAAGIFFPFTHVQVCKDKGKLVFKCAVYSYFTLFPSQHSCRPGLLEPAWRCRASALY